MTSDPGSDRDASRVAASQRIADHLRTAILSGEIPPGGRLRQEEIAERLGVSRLPVREALRILEAEGLTEHAANKGSRVPLLDQDEVRTLYLMRERLEPLALIESMAHLKPADLQRLTRLQDQIEADDNLVRFLELDREFHLASYSGCPAEQLLGTVTRLWNATQHYRRTYVVVSGPQRRWVVNCEHRLILDAITRNDPVDAERYLSGHIRRTRIELTARPDLFKAAAGRASTIRPVPRRLP